FASARPNLTTVLATAPISGAPQARVVEDPSVLSNVLRTFLGPAKAPAMKTPAAKVSDGSAENASPALVVGRYRRGRTMALAVPITAPYADEFSQKWGVGDNRY